MIIKEDGDRGDPEILFVSPNVHSKGIGYAEEILQAKGKLK